MSALLPLQGGWPDEPEQPVAPALYWLWLAALLRPGSAYSGRVIEEYGTARAVYEQRFDLARFQKVTGRAAAKRLAECERSPADFEPLLAHCNKKGIRVVPYDDPEYPLPLCRVEDPPLVLYCTGQTRWLNAIYTVGMVGSRRPTPYGVQAAARLGDQLAKGGAVIVSGLADGLDGEAHKAAVRQQVPTIGVMGVPIDRTYPPGNAGLRGQIERCGVVISEYPPGETVTHRSAFLQRNRIIAALSRVLLVVEARQQSGTMSTVNHAIRYGRSVYAVPGSVFSAPSEGTNELLRTGMAIPAIEAGEILRRIGLAPAPPAFRQENPPQPPLPPNAQAVLACMGPTPIGLEALGEKTGLPMGRLLSALITLQTAGCVTPLPGQQYVLS